MTNPVQILRSALAGEWTMNKIWKALSNDLGLAENQLKSALSQQRNFEYAYSVQVICQFIG